MKHIGFTNKEQWIELLSNKDAIRQKVSNTLEYQEQTCIKIIKEFYHNDKGIWGNTHQ